MCSGRTPMRVAAEIAQEVAVLLEDRDADAGPGEQETEHHSGGATPADAALNGHAGC
jgi:hypothetical protein